MWISATMPQTNQPQQQAAHNAVNDPDHPLVERARAGEEAAFAELVQRYQRPLYALVFRYVRNEDTAADLVQNTFVRVLSQFDQFRGTGRFRTWLYRIAANLAKNYLRDQKRWRTTPLEPFHLSQDPPGLQRLLLEEDQQRLYEALDSLPPKQRLTVELRIFQNLPFKEVAAIMECSENTAKVNFHYALKSLRQRMNKKRPPPPHNSGPLPSP